MPGMQLRFGFDQPDPRDQRHQGLLPTVRARRSHAGGGFSELPVTKLEFLERARENLRVDVKIIPRDDSIEIRDKLIVRWFWDRSLPTATIIGSWVTLQNPTPAQMFRIAMGKLPRVPEHVRYTRPTGDRRRKLVANLIKIYGLECYWCKAQLVRNSLTIDHLIPISKGGTNQMVNVVLSCVSCNRENKDVPSGRTRKVLRKWSSSSTTRPATPRSSSSSPAETETLSPSSAASKLLFSEGECLPTRFVSSRTKPPPATTTTSSSPACDGSPATEVVTIRFSTAKYVPREYPIFAEPKELEE